MTDLPRRPIRPLPPPPGSFEQTVARGRARRRRALVGAASAGLAAVAVAAIVGVTAIGRVGAQHDLRPAVPVVSSPPSSAPSSAPASASPTQSTAASSSASPSTTAPVVVSPPASPPVVVSSPPPSAPASVAPAMYHGRLTDAAHHPLKGYYLYWDSPGLITAQAPNELSVDQPAATTPADGTFDVPCGTVTNPSLAISAVQIPPDAHSNLISPNDNKHENEVYVRYTGANSILTLVDVRHGCDPGAPRQTTIFQPNATVTGTLSIDGKLYSAADAARAATVQPGEAGSDLFLGAGFNSPNGQGLADGIFPEPGTGVFTLRGLAPGDIVFLVAQSSSVKVPVVDGQVVKVAVAVTTGSLPTGGDATISVTVVP